MTQIYVHNCNACTQMPAAECEQIWKVQSEIKWWLFFQMDMSEATKLLNSKSICDSKDLCLEITLTLMGPQSTREDKK